MKILLTNDDGWDAVGLKMLCQAAAKFGEITVVAPEKQQSGVSHQLTLHRSMAFVERGANHYSLDGTPADCVRIGVSQLAQKFDWVLAGVNDGGNLGADLFLSGTVAAAREANFLNVPAVALSQYRSKYNDPFPWEDSCMMATRVLERVFSEERLGVPLINVNLPDTTLEPNPETVPIVECRCDMHSFPLAYAKRENGFDYVGRYSQRQFEPENDVGICFGGQISWTWLTRDLNAR